MRTHPLVGDKVWFKPRRGINWGWSPASWEGWAVALASIGGLLAPCWFAPARHWAWIAGVVAASLAACVLKGTTPGGRRRHAEYRRRSGGDRPAGDF